MTGIDYSADSAIGVGHNSQNVSDVAIIADELITLQAEAAALEDKLAAVKRQITAIETKTLPTAIEALGVESFKLPNGVEISIDSGLNLSVPKKRKAEVIKYIVNELELGEIVKYEWQSTLPKGAEGEKLVELFKEFCAKHELSGNAVLDVHTGSLKSHVNALIKEGKKSVDLELLGANSWRKANVTMPK